MPVVTRKRGREISTVTSTAPDTKQITSKSAASPSVAHGASASDLPRSACRAIEHFHSNCGSHGAVLAAAIAAAKSVPDFSPSAEIEGNALEHLARSIVYQQLAVGAAAKIWQRVCEAVRRETPELATAGDATAASRGAEDREPLHWTASAVFSASEKGLLRAAGLSARTVEYLEAAAAAFEPGGTLGDMPESNIRGLGDEELFTRLTAIKGIGPWTAHMFILFHTRHADLVPSGDLGIRQGVQILFGLPTLPSNSRVDDLCKVFAPYRSFAAYGLWEHVGAVRAEAKEAKAQQSSPKRKRAQ